MKEMSLIDKKVFMFEFRLLRKPAHSCSVAHKMKRDIWMQISDPIFKTQMLSSMED